MHAAASEDRRSRSELVLGSEPNRFVAAEPDTGGDREVRDALVRVHRAGDGP